MTPSLRSIAVLRAASAQPTVVVEVVATRGSAPRDRGTRMLVWAEGTAGTIGGGHLEWQAIAKARAALSRPAAMPADEEIALGASLGQCCGGAVTLRYALLDDAALRAWRDERVLVPIQIYGAGHVGRAIVRLLEPLAFQVQWIDERDDAFPLESTAPNVECVCVEPVEAEVGTAPPGCLYLVLTHQHDLDLRIVEAIVMRGDFSFLGLIGSTTKRRRFEQLLQQRGFDPDVVARIACPIGIDGIAGKEPEVIAIATAAQLLRHASLTGAATRQRSSGRAAPVLRR